jgi:hypothetical protein
MDELPIEMVINFHDKPFMLHGIFEHHSFRESTHSWHFFALDEGTSTLW